MKKDFLKNFYFIESNHKIYLWFLNNLFFNYEFKNYGKKF